MTNEVLEEANKNRAELKKLLERRKQIHDALDGMRRMKTNGLQTAYVTIYDEVIGMRVDDLVQLLANSLWETSKEIAILNKDFELL